MQLTVGFVLIIDMLVFVISDIPKNKVAQCSKIISKISNDFEIKDFINLKQLFSTVVATTESETLQTLLSDRVSGLLSFLLDPNRSVNWYTERSNYARFRIAIDFFIFLSFCRQIPIPISNDSRIPFNYY